MKKAIIFLSVVVAVVIALPAFAWAGGWSEEPVPAGNPHAGYATSTSKCKLCHAVHEAEDAANTLNGEKLLRSTVTGSCDYCHVGGGFAASQVYNSLPATYMADTGKEHTLSSANTTIPDSGDETGQADPANDHVLAGFNCVSCHAVHGANTILGELGTIIKDDPGPSTKFTVTTLTGFCADCHDNNYATVKDLVGGPDQTSHYMGAITSATLTASDSSRCKDCHWGGNGTAASHFPHRTNGLKLLKDRYDGTGVHEMDSVCLDCHRNVGVDF